MDIEQVDNSPLLTLLSTSMLRISVDVQIVAYVRVFVGTFLMIALHSEVDEREKSGSRQQKEWGFG